MNANWISQLENLLGEKNTKKNCEANGINFPKIKNEVQNETNYEQKDYHNLTSYNIKKEIISNYQKENINRLYSWQKECLCELKKVKWEERENFLFVAQTSGGKTLVAEIFAFEEIKKTEKIFFLFPLNSLINEKLEYFKKICKGTDIQIGSEFDQNDIILCTYEKFNNYLNKNKLKYSTEDISSQGYDYASQKNYNYDNHSNEDKKYIVIIDEFHLISEKGRGIYIENIISKSLYLNKKKPRIKIICMSATLNNMHRLKKWLNAKIYISSYRPQVVSEHYVCNYDIYKKGSEFDYYYLNNMYNFCTSYENVRDNNPLPCYRSTINYKVEKAVIHDIDCVTPRRNDYATPIKYGYQTQLNAQSELFKNKIYNFLQQKNQSLNNDLIQTILCFSYHSLVKNINTLIFCSTKRNCEIYINLINQFISGLSIDNVPEHIKIKREKLNERILQIDKYAYEKMNKLITNGICYYYSDIGNSIKRLLENFYKEKVLFLLTCTSTLAVGLNLLVDRVLIASPFIAQNFLTITQYKQMIGRAARLKEGDSFLIVEKKHEKKILQLFKENVTNIKSTMNNGSQEEIEKYIIEFLCLVDQPMTFHDIISLFSYSLCFVEFTLNDNEIDENYITNTNGNEHILDNIAYIYHFGSSGMNTFYEELDMYCNDNSWIGKEITSVSSMKHFDQNELTPIKYECSPYHISSTTPRKIDHKKGGKCASTTNMSLHNLLELNLHTFTQDELLFYEKTKKEINTAINNLIKHKCIEIINQKKIKATKLCRSLCISNFTITYGIDLLNEIKSYDKIHTYNNKFHLCYICSCHNLNIAGFIYYLPFLKNLISIISFDNYTKYIIFEILKFDNDIINMLNLKNQNISHDQKKKKFFSDNLVQKKYNKLYLAILLFLYLQGANISTICTIFKIPKDVLKSILQNTYIHIHILIAFFDELDEWIISCLLKKFLQHFKSTKPVSENNSDEFFQVAEFNYSKYYSKKRKKEKNTQWHK
ncbi:DEAD/DEAH box helicase, putative [Plasmodium vinckei]|uniref:DEAD/DEAH box helicase, putative n=1 Tax=Plasmodium vinckei TaxID=5860 RepID=A0A6V7T3R9_PLAVN|nr:DEAD/DEAH box helicase, putative [Plasmodium vinckei]